MSRKEQSAKEADEFFGTTQNTPPKPEPKAKRQRKVNPLPFVVKTVIIGEGIKLAAILNEREVLSLYMSVEGSTFNPMPGDEKTIALFGKVFKMRGGPAQIISRFANREDVTLPFTMSPDDKKHDEPTL